MVRIPDFFDREYERATDLDTLFCRECGAGTTFDHSELPPNGEVMPCPECNLESRVPALPSEAGVDDPGPPVTDERS